MFVLLGIHLALIGVCYFQFATRSSGQFFAVPPNGDTFQIIPLDRPNVSTKALLSWATLAATATFSFDFVNYKDQLSALQDYFTIEGYDNFITSLQNNNILNTIESTKLVLSAVSIGPAIVLIEEELGERHTWHIQVPLLVRYQSASSNETRQQVVDLLITQVPTRDAPTGIGIAQYVAREGGPELSV